ncbi:transposase [Escherichia coli]|nr:transposase [Escherichia coli]EJP7978476.1 transposase [Escherichia coli]EKR8912960.1 transposase [Escherichia coli]
MEQKTLSVEPHRSFSNEFKLQMVKLALQPRGSVARIAREHDINDNLLFKWLSVTNGAIVIHTQRLKSDPGGNLLS